jgi:hypothetical protein
MPCAVPVSWKVEDMLKSEQKSKRNPVLYLKRFFLQAFLETCFFLRLRERHVIDIETKQTKASIMGKFPYRSEANQSSPEFFIIETKRTNLDHNIFSSSEANKISQEFFFTQAKRTSLVHFIFKPSEQV